MPFDPDSTSSPASDVDAASSTDPWADAPADPAADAPADPAADAPADPAAGAPHRTATTLPEAREITRARARDVGSLLRRYVRRHLPPSEPPAPTPSEPPRVEGAYAHLLVLLQLVPWLLAVLFVVSFAWDFDGRTITLLGQPRPLEGLLKTLSVSGLIGFFTNWLAITMLFHPRKRRPIFGQGLIPAQRERVIFRLAKAISDELINEEIIKRKIEESGVIPRYRTLTLSVARGVIEDPDFRRDLKTITSDYVQTVLASEPVRRKIADFTVEKVEQYASRGLGGLALRAYRYFGEDDFQRRIDEAVRELPDSVDPVLDEMDALLDRIPEKLEARADDIEAWATKSVLTLVEQLDVYGLVIENMRQYDEQQLENLLKRTSNEQLNYIKYLGGVLGFFGGLVIWQPILALAVFGTLGGILLALDVVLARRAA